MSTKLSFFSDPASGKSRRQLDFEEIYVSFGVNVLPIIHDAHRKTLDDASKEPPEFIDKSYWAQNMNRNMVGFLRKRHPGLVHYDEEKRVYLKLGDSVRVYFKKLDKKYRPSNIPTDHVNELNSAYGQLFGRELSVLYVGPKLREDKIWDEIDCFMVEMKTHRDCEWVSDLDELSGRMGGGAIHAIPTVPVAPAAPAVSVKVKNKQKGKDQAASS